MDPNEIKKELDEILELASHKPNETNTQTLLDAVVSSEQTTKINPNTLDMEQLMDPSQSAVTVSAMTQHNVDIVESPMANVVFQSDRSHHDISSTNFHLNNSPVSVEVEHPAENPSQDEILVDVTQIDLTEVEQQIELKDDEIVDFQHQTEQPLAKTVSDVIKLASEVSAAGSSGQENDMNTTYSIRHDQGAPFFNEDYQMVEFEPTDESTESSHGEHLLSDFELDEDFEAQDKKSEIEEDHLIEEGQVEIIEFQHNWQDPIAFAMLPEDDIKSASLADKQFVFGTLEAASDKTPLPKPTQNEVPEPLEIVDDSLDLKNEETLSEDLTIHVNQQEENEVADYSRGSIEVETLCCVDAQPPVPNAEFLEEDENQLVEKMPQLTESKAKIEIYTPNVEENKVIQEEQIDIAKDVRSEKLESEDQIRLADHGELHDFSDCPCGCLCEGCQPTKILYEEDENSIRQKDEFEITSSQAENLVKEDSDGYSEIESLKHENHEDVELPLETSEKEAVIESKESFESSPIANIEPQSSEEQASRVSSEQPLSFDTKGTVLEDDSKTETLNTVILDKRVSWQIDIEKEEADVALSKMIEKGFDSENEATVALESRQFAPLQSQFQASDHSITFDIEANFQSDESFYQIVDPAQSVEGVKVLSIPSVEYLENENIEDADNIGLPLKTKLKQAIFGFAPEEEIEKAREQQRQSRDSSLERIESEASSQRVEHQKEDELEKVFLAELSRIASRSSGPEPVDDKMELEQSFSFEESVEDSKQQEDKFDVDEISEEKVLEASTQEIDIHDEPSDDSSARSQERFHPNDSIQSDNQMASDSKLDDSLETFETDFQNILNAKNPGTDSFLLKTIFSEIKKQMKSPSSSQEKLEPSQTETRVEGMKPSEISRTSDQLNTEAEIESTFEKVLESNEDSETPAHVEQSLASATEETVLKFNPEFATLNGAILEQERRSSRVSWLTELRQREAAWIAHEEAEEKAHERRTSKDPVIAPLQQLDTGENPENLACPDNSGKSSKSLHDDDKNSQLEETLKESSSEILEKLNQTAEAEMLTRDFAMKSKALVDGAAASLASKLDRDFPSSASFEQMDETLEDVSASECVKNDCPVAADPDADHQEHATFEEVSHKIFESHEAHEPRLSDEIQVPVKPKETVLEFDPKNEIMTAVIPNQEKRISQLNSMTEMKQEEVVVTETSSDVEPSTVSIHRLPSKTLRRAEGSEDLPSLVSPDKPSTAETSTRICGCALKKMIQESLTEDKFKPKVTGAIKKTKVKFPNESISIISVSVMNVDIEDFSSNNRTISEKIKNRRATTAVLNRTYDVDDDDEDGFGNQSLPNVPSNQLSQTSSRAWISENVSFGADGPSFHQTTPLGKLATNKVTKVKSFTSIDLTKPFESSDLAKSSEPIEKRDSKLRKCKCFLKRVSKVFRKKKE